MFCKYESFYQLTSHKTNGKLLQFQISLAKVTLYYLELKNIFIYLHSLH